jgi:hypothetical protein
MNEKISFWMKLTKSPKLIDAEQDIWIFYCPIDKKWHKGMRHGYTDQFYTQMYFECEDGHIIPAPGWWK